MPNTGHATPSTVMRPNRRLTRRAQLLTAALLATAAAGASTLSLVGGPHGDRPGTVNATAPSAPATGSQFGTATGPDTTNPSTTQQPEPAPGHDEDAWAVEQVAAVRAFPGPIYTLEDAGPAGYPLREHGTGAPTAFVEVAPGHVAVTTLKDGTAQPCRPGTRPSSQGPVTVTCTQLTGGGVLTAATPAPDSVAAEAGPTYTVDVPAGPGADARITFTEEAWAGPETAEVIAEAALDRLTVLDKDAYTPVELAEALEAGHADH